MKQLPALLLTFSMCALPLAPALSAEAAATPGHAAVRDGGSEAANKQQITRLYQLMGADPQAAGRLFAHDLIQHDPQLADGRDAITRWIAGLGRQVWTVKHMLAERDLVFVHAHLGESAADEWHGNNRYDLYRLDRGLVVEHWAVTAPAPQRSANGNSAFSDVYHYTGGAPATDPARVELNRLLARSLSEDVFGKRQFGLLDRFWASGYLQHNPYVANGRAALASVLPYIAPPGASYRVMHAMADGDLALVCAHAADPGANPDAPFSGTAVCDLYRMVNYEMVEHWDVAQAIPGSSVNGHAMFGSLYGKHRQGHD
ncbi:hypothetical protein GCM10027277_41130 [Pseudoduganella ginsengisoli]|uniref:SnoaL-like domain-containing protein n=1 Tax=Pseudoduganella ginsengisoli TaxID=1462440 RepID=A0A6L6PY12_9BURK|nr:nuclear transport factor 2 family protein [Pseudoduganella ginsengisoli]MTW01818.1 hypothetical protein [Pseudoduganella ginsengisoli]